MIPVDWTSGDRPAEPGFYAAGRCWDAQEGIILGALHWPEGADRWWPVVMFAGPFPTEQAALDWAYAHDPEDY